MVNPQEDDDDYGDLEDTTGDAGEVLLPDTTLAPQSHRAEAEGETLNVSAGEVCMVFCEILKYKKNINSFQMPSPDCVITMYLHQPQ